MSHTESTTSELQTNSHSLPTQRLATPVSNASTCNSVNNVSTENYLYHSTEPIYTKEKAILSQHLHSNNTGYNNAESLYSQTTHMRSNTSLNMASQNESGSWNNVSQAIAKPPRGHGKYAYSILINWLIINKHTFII